MDYCSHSPTRTSQNRTQSVVEGGCSTARACCLV